MYFFSVDNKVIIIIGGDDNYKNKDEEDRVVISRWARMKIQSQFKEEFLDGRKSFIFSWKKNHREIHEEALRHYFDPQRKGQKFEYQPKQVVKAAHASSEKAPLQKYQSMDDQRGREGIGSSNSSNAEQRRQDFASGSSLKSSATPSERTPLHRYHSMNDQPEEGIRSSSSSSSEQRRGGFSVGRSRSADETGEQSSFSSPHNAGQTRDDHSFRSTTGKATFDSEHGGKAKETRSASAARITITGKGLRANLVHWYRLKKILRVSFHKLEKSRFENDIRNNRRSLLMLRRNINLLNSFLIKLFITLTKMNAHSVRKQ